MDAYVQFFQAGLSRVRKAKVGFKKLDYLVYPLVKTARFYDH